ncbi:PQQ-binding-like beta-propeller repeat protein [Halovenus rubra]|uniref:PQQ-binding-like beta-propeller repeat protein n=2 Tax=Halovenus rubra TaxID=869890 RepID=A0ABD5XB04_9EURY|nr:PQQ-binding-like beta-propeller repeat protein [Halovenus rubra]
MISENTSVEHEDSDAKKHHEWDTLRGGMDRTGSAGDAPTEAVRAAWTYEGDRGLDSAPAVDGTTAYIGDSSEVAAIDIESGDRLWSFEADDTIGGNPVVADGTVYVGSYDQHFYAIDADTGMEEWAFEPTGSGFSIVVSTATVVGDKVYVGCNDGNVYAIDTESGEERWSFATDDKITSSPAVVDGIVYVASQDTTLYAINAETGVREWEYEAGGRVSIESSPAVADGTVYLAGSGRLYAVDAETGQKQWSFDCSSGKKTPVVGDNRVYLAGQGELHAVDTASGEEVWQAEFEYDLDLSPVYADGTLYQPHYDTLVALDPENGDKQWTFETGDSIQAAPAVTYGALFLTSQDRNLYALTEDGEPVDVPEAAIDDSDDDGEIDVSEEPGWSTDRGDLARTGHSEGVGPTEQVEARWSYEPEDTKQGIAALDGTVYLTDESGVLVAIDQETGAPEWEFEAGRGIPCAPSVTDGTVYVGSRDEHLYAVDAESGEEQWSVEATGSFATFGSPPTVADGVVYASCEDGTLYAVDADSGSVEWTFERRSDFTCSPAVVNGMAIAGAGNTLYAVDIESGEMRWQFESGGIGDIDSSPAVVGDTLYFGGTEKEFHALSVEQGMEQWTVELDDSVNSAVAVVNGTVYAGADDATLYAFDAATGDEEWAVPVDNAMRSAPAVADGIVYATSGSQIQAHDADNGRELFSFEHTGDLSLSPVVANGTLYAGGYEFNAFGEYRPDAVPSQDAKDTDEDAEAAAEDADEADDAAEDVTTPDEVEGWATLRGTVDRTGSAGDAPTEAVRAAWTYEGDRGLDSAPAVDGTTAYIGDSSEVAAVDIESGDRLWSFEADDTIGGNPVVADGTVYAGSYDQHFYAIDADTGMEEWAFEPTGSGFNYVKSTATVVGDKVYVGCSDGNVYAIDTDSGEEWWSFATDDKIMGSPAVVDGIVYVASQDTTLYAINAETGVREWEYETGGRVSVESSATVADGTVYLAGSGQQLCAVDAETGQEQWSFDCSSGKKTPVVGDNRVYLAGQGELHAVDTVSGEEVWQVEFEYDLDLSPVYADGTLYQPHHDTLVALDPETGDQQWTFETGDSIQAAPAVTYGALFLTSQDRNLYALTEDGAPVDVPEAAIDDSDDDDAIDVSEEPGWSTDRGTLARTGAISGSGPTEEPTSRWEYETDDRKQGIAALNGTLYVTSEDSTLTALEPSTGAAKWEFEAGRGIPCAPSVTDETVYVGSRDEHLYAVDAESGEEQWSVEATGSFATFGSPPTVADGVVYAPCEDGTLYAVDTDSGSIEWTFERRSDFTCSPAVVNGMAIAGAGNTLYAVDIESGEMRWQFESGGIGDIESSPAVVGDSIYFGGTEKELHALSVEQGMEQWTVELDDSVKGPVAVVDGTVYAGTDDATLYALEAESGDEEWAVPVDDAMRSGPAVSDGIVYATAGTQIQAHDADNGRELFSVEQYGDLDLSPVVADGTLYTGGYGFNAYGDLDDAGNESATDEAATDDAADDTAATADSGSVSSDHEPDTNFAASAADDTEDPNDDQLKEAILGVLCDEWQRFNRDVRLGFDQITDRVSEVLPGGTEGLVKHNVQRLAEDGYVELGPTGETVFLRARGVGKYQNLSDERVVPDADIIEVLDPLYEQARHHPDHPGMGREELLEEVYLDEDKLDRTIWFLQDVGMDLGGIILNGAGYIDVVAQGSSPWWISVNINKFGKDLYEELS